MRNFVYCSVKAAVIVIVYLALVICLGPRPAHAELIPASLDQARDPELQNQLQTALNNRGFGSAVRYGSLALALVDITDPRHPRFAGMNEDAMMYAASLPKIAILFGLFKRIEEGSLPLTNWTLSKATQMIRVSSNESATELYHLVGPHYISELMRAPRYGLYDPQSGGGLWCGKEYGKKAAWEREPIRHLSHAATPRKVAQFYYLLDTGQLVNPELTEVMKSVLTNPGINHKFVRGLKHHYPEAQMYRKSGSWGEFHSDSALIAHNGKRYIAVGLTQHPRGSLWLEELIVLLDSLVLPAGKRPVVMAKVGS